MAADRAIDRAMVEAGAAADAAQHVGELVAEHLAPPIVEQHDVIGGWTVWIAVAARAGEQARIGGDLLAGGRARQQAQNRRGVLERRHQLLDRGDDDMHARQGRGQVAVALVGDDHRRAGLGDQQIGAGDADIGGEEFFPQQRPRLGHQIFRPVEPALARQALVLAAKFLLDGLFVEMDDRGDDMARPLASELHDIFAEIGLDHLDLRGLEMRVEPDLLAHHRLAFGDELGAGLFAEPEHDGPRIGGGGRVMHFAAALDHLALIGLEIEIEMRQRMVLDGAGFLAQRVEFGQLRLGCRALGDETALDVEQRLLQRSVGEGLSSGRPEVMLCVCHPPGPPLIASGAARRSPGRPSSRPTPPPRGAPRPPPLRARAGRRSA